MGEILFLAHRVPFPPNRGDKIRAHHLLKRLAELARVHVGCFSETTQDRAAASEVAAIAQSHCVVDRKKPLVLAGAEAVLAGKPVSLTAFHSARLESWVRQTLATHPIDTIVVFSGQMGQYVPHDFPGRVVIDLCDVDSAKFEGYAQAGHREWLNAREARLLAIEEDRLGRRADATVLITENEAALYRSRLSDPAEVMVQVIGNGIDTKFFHRGQVAVPERDADKAGPNFVFVGQMDYPPNEQAARWIVDKFMPQIREVYPGAQTAIVGRNPTARLLRKQHERGVTITGEVADVRPYLAGADLVLAPLMLARGVQNKVLEAMAMQCPVLLTPQAANGIAAEHGKHWTIAEPDPQAFCEAARHLLADPQGRQLMGEEARKFVTEHHTWAAMLAPLDAILGLGAEVRDAA